MVFKRSALRYGETPEPITPYQKAAQAWDERIGSARVQAHNWRLMALGNLGMSLLLAGILFWVGRTGGVVPYIVEVDSRGGARSVAPADESYKPSDAQIAYHLARFFDDGNKVYIQFPSGISKSEAPPLFIIGPDGKSALVNYRVRGTTYIVDRLFAAAELRLGTEPQRVVRIVRTDAIWRETRS